VESLIDDLPHPGPLPKERENRSAASAKSMRLDLARDGEHELPLPGGEGWGEGERLPTFLFCDNETNARRLYGQADAQGFFKDGLGEYVVHGNQSAVNSNRAGTKAGVLYKLAIPAGGSTSVRLRLVAADVRRRTPDGNGESASSPRRLQPFADFDAI